MCLENIFPGLFGGGGGKTTVVEQTVAAAPPTAVAATREKRKAGVVKSEGDVTPRAAKPVQVSGGGNTSIGIGIGTPDSPRKRTTELGL